MLQALQDLRGSEDVDIEIRRGIPVMAAVPAASDSITDFPLLLSISDCHHIAYALVSRNDGEGVAEESVFDSVIRMADTTGEDFDQNLQHALDWNAGY